ncbi:MAG: FHA domain-containing protein [Kofleriaceae bacterium]
MAVRLSFESGSLAGTHIITAASRLRLGRDPQLNDLLLTDPKVSRKHALIERSVRGGYAVEVLGAGHSTINGDPIAALGGRSTVHPLSTGDRLAFGDIRFDFAEADVKLMAVSGPSAGREIFLGETVRVGSGQDCDLVLEDPAVSAEHLVVTSTPLGFRATARDTTLFNAAAAAERMLSHGDELMLGTTTLRFTVTVAGEAIDAEASMGSMTSIIVSSNAVGELVVLSGAAKGDRIPLGDAQIILGTHGDCTFVLSDPLASPMHAVVSRSGDELVATDIGSETGTFINGDRISQGTALKPGDLIAVGSHVLEARLLGGVSNATKGATLYATRAPGTMGGPEPRFVIDGRVVKTRKIVIGRAPSCDVVVDGSSVSREHCQIEWGDGFAVRDTSSQGTYLDDRRVVQQQLPPSCVLRIVDTLFRVAVRGEVCTIERADAALAHAAVDVARAQASRFMSSAELRTAAARPAGSGGGELKTIFRMTAGALENEINARKKDLKRGAPAWRPSSDLATNRAMRGVVAGSVIAALALCGAVLAFGRGRALVNHSLSPAHSSTAFTAKANATTVCASCHTSGAAVASGRCETCHQGFAPRVAHRDSCGGCHVEHRGSTGGPTLGALGSCTSCHVNQHANELSPAAIVPQRLAAGPLPDTPVDTLALHAAHSRRVVAGQDVGIGCTSCHGTLEAGVLVEGKPGLACYRCHTGGEAAMTTGCDRCHGREHTVALARMTPAERGPPSLDVPGQFASLGWAIGLAFVGGVPGLSIAAWLRMRRKREANALIDELKAHPAEVVKRLVHSINDSKCVGCGLCVQACPASVLELVEHKSRVVNFDSCIQCKKCEHACAFDALRMHDADKPPPMIPMPSVDAFHETPIAGMFLVGQASGTPQVKNAVNLGRAAIQRIVQQGFQPGTASTLGCDLDVVIIGSGPAGLSAAITCLELGLSYVVLEKERAFAWTIRNYFHKGKEVMAEPHDIGLESSLPHWDTTREQLLGVWQDMLTEHRVDVRYQHDVTDVNKQGDKFIVKLGDPKGRAIGQLTCARVVLAIGTLGNPRRLGCPGDELEKVKNSLVDPDEWSGRNVLVVGGSDSAVEVVLALSTPERRNAVWFSTRGAKLEGIKPKNRKLIEAALAAGRFTMCYATTVAEVTAAGVVLSYKEDGRREELANDVVFAMIGGTSPQKWLQHIGVPYVDKPHSWSPPRTDLLSQKTAEGLISVRRLIRVLPPRA